MKVPHTIKLAAAAQCIIDRLEDQGHTVKLSWVHRNFNTSADRLANTAATNCVSTYFTEDDSEIFNEFMIASSSASSARPISDRLLQLISLHASSSPLPTTLNIPTRQDTSNNNDVDALNTTLNPNGAQTQVATVLRAIPR